MAINAVFISIDPSWREWIVVIKKSMTCITQTGNGVLYLLVSISLMNIIGGQLKKWTDTKQKDVGLLSIKSVHGDRQ